MSLEAKTSGNGTPGSPSPEELRTKLGQVGAIDAEFEVIKEPESVLRVVKDERPDGKDRVKDFVKPLKKGDVANPNNAQENFTALSKIWNETPSDFDLKEARIAELKKNLGYAQDQDPEISLDDKFAQGKKNVDASIKARKYETKLIKKALEGNPRRGVSSERPFPDPKLSVSKEVIPPAPKASKPEVTYKLLRPEDRPRLIDREQLGKKQEVNEEAAQIEAIAQKLFTNGILTKKEEDFKDEHPQVLKRLRELLGSDYEKGLSQTMEAPVAEPARTEVARVLGQNLPVLATSRELARTGVPKQGVDELVGFHLGKLGIKPEEILEQFPEFLNLSKNQQIYTIKKLEQKANRDLDRESVNKLDENDKANKKGGWFGRVGRSLTKGSRLSMLRSKMEGENKAGGLASYKERLQDLTALVERRGIQIEPGEGGQMVLQFLSHEGNEDPKRKKLVENFNLQASKVADVPYDWTVDHATPALKAQYKLIKRSFEKAREALVAYESKTTAEENLGEKLLEINSVDSEIEMSQFLNHNTGIVGKVNQFIKNNKYLEGKIGMAIGMGARELGKNAIVFGGGIVAAAVTGGFTSWFRKRAELRRLEEDQRAGIDVGKEKAKTVKKSIDIVTFTKKIKQLTEHAAKATGDSKQRTLDTLQTRIMIAQDRIQNLGVVNFGGGRNELVNQYEFTRAIKEASRVLMESTSIADQVGSDVYERFDKTYLQDEEKSAERKRQLTKAFKRGALIGGGASVLGYVGMDLAFHKGEGVAAAWREVESNVYAANEYMHNGFEPVNVMMDKGDAIRSINPVSTTEQAANFPRPDNLPYTADQIVVPPPMPIAESDFGARGAIGAIKDLQRALINQYGGNMPENLKEFVDANPDRLAIKWNMFRPGDMNESIALPKGTKFLALPDGNISLRFPDGKLLGITNVTEKMQFDYFDSGARTAAPTIPNTPANPDMANQVFVSAPENNLSGVDSPQGMNGAPENLGAGTGAETGGKFDFERVKTGLKNLGFRHEAVDGGDIFSAEVPTGEDAGPQTVEGYADIDGLKVDTKELKGTIDFLYDSKGQIKNIDLPALQVEDVSRFRANPQDFIGGSHDVAERAMLGKKLMTVNSQVETFLKYRRIMEVQSLHPDSPEYRFLHEESNKLWSAIQKKVEYQFNPDYNGFRPNPIENTAPQVEVPDRVAAPIDNSPVPNSGERPPFVRNLGETSSVETPAASPETGATSEIIRTNRDVIPADSILLQESFASTYGGVERVDGNVVFFKDGHVGFYAESLKQGIAERSAKTLAAANAENLGINMEGPFKKVATQMPNGGPIRYLAIYEKVK